MHAWGREAPRSSRRPSLVLAKFFISAVINVAQSTLACSGAARGRRGETQETEGLTFTGRRGQAENEQLWNLLDREMEIASCFLNYPVAGAIERS